MKEQKLKSKSYRLADDQGGEASMLDVGRKRQLLVFDKEAKRNRAIRHCPNEKSIFIDEQSEHALVTPIIFYTGYLEVDARDQITQSFLDAHPSNTANGGIWFEEIDDEMEAEESIALDELKMDIKQAIRNKSEEQDGFYALAAVVAALNGSIVKTSEMGMQELKSNLYSEVERDPLYFVDDQMEVDIFENDYIFRKHLVLTAINQGIIKKSTNSKSILWVKDKKVIATAPQSVDTIEYFTNFLTTDEGLLVVDEIKRRS